MDAVSAATVTDSVPTLLAVTLRPVIPCAVVSKVLERLVNVLPPFNLNSASVPLERVAPTIPSELANPPVSSDRKIPIFPV